MNRRTRFAAADAPPSALEARQASPRPSARTKAKDAKAEAGEKLTKSEKPSNKSLAAGAVGNLVEDSSLVAGATASEKPSNKLPTAGARQGGEKSEKPSNKSPTAGAPTAGAGVLVLRGIHRSFASGAGAVRVLRGVDLELRRGEVAALVGPSGSGKSTLLHCAGLLERPNAGDIVIAGQPLTRLDDASRTALRRRHIGFVYQAHHLLPEFSALENVALAYRIAGGRRDIAALRAQDLLERMGLEDRLHHRPAELSGGEQQRVAIARALVNRPALLLADEPTGSLDIRTASDVFRLLAGLVRGLGTAALVATHNESLARRMDRQFAMRLGKVHRLPSSRVRRARSGLE